MSATSMTRVDPLMLRRFQAMAEETRLRIVQLLMGGELCVCELQAELTAAQSRLSFHLRKLKDAGLVRDRPDGRWVYYSVVPEAIEEMRAFLGEVSSAPRAGSVVPGPGLPILARTGAACCDDLAASPVQR